MIIAYDLGNIYFSFRHWLSIPCMREGYVGFLLGQKGISKRRFNMTTPMALAATLPLKTSILLLITSIDGSNQIPNQPIQFIFIHKLNNSIDTLHVNPLKCFPPHAASFSTHRTALTRVPASPCVSNRIQNASRQTTNLQKNRPEERQIHAFDFEKENRLKQEEPAEKEKYKRQLDVRKGS